MDEIAQLLVKTYGILGLFMAAPFVAVGMLWREMSTTRREAAKALADANDKVIAAMDKRFEDSQLVRDRMMTLVSEQAAASRETNLALENIGDYISTHAAQLPPFGRPPTNPGSGG